MMHDEVSKSWKQSTIAFLYRAAKTCFQLVPSQVLRFRPFGVYEISLAEAARQATIPKQSDPSLRIDWAAHREGLAKLTDVAAPENLDSWNGTTRRVAIAWREEVPIGAVWIATESFAETDLGLSFRLQPDEAWLFAAVVEQSQRRQGIYKHLLQFVTNELAGENRTRLLLGVSTGNQASLAAHRRFGAEQVGSIFAAKCLGFGFCRASGDIHRESRAIVWNRAIAVNTN